MGKGAIVASETTTNLVEAVADAHVAAATKSARNLKGMLAVVCHMRPIFADCSSVNLSAWLGNLARLIFVCAHQHTHAKLT